MKKLVAYCMVVSTILLFSGCYTGNRQDIGLLLDPAALPKLKTSKMIQVSSTDTSGGNNDRITIAPGHKATIFDAEGPGMITRIWLAVKSDDPHLLRRVVIRMYWDDEIRPSVEVPLGDFFGNGFSYKPYVSQYLGMTSGGFVCYFPMPFESKARIEISNETLHAISGLYFQVNYQKFEAALESDVAYFHATWRRDIRTDYDSNYTLLNLTGKGHIVGVNLNIQAYEGGYNYLEGDEMVYVDGERKPSILGTGTEDFFSGGWYFNAGTFSGPLNGLIEKDDSLHRIAAYRFYINDPIPFRKAIRFTLEHGHANQEVADYSSTVYWYQMEPHQPFPALPKAGQRIPLRMVKPRMHEAEKLPFRLGGVRSTVVDMSDYGPDWSENKHLVIEASRGSSFGVDFRGLKDVLYDVTVYYSKSPSFGNAEVLVNGERSGEITGYSPYMLPDGKLVIRGVRNPGGTISIDFRVNGKVESSSGYAVGIDGIGLVPRRIFIPDWFVAGPFANPRRGSALRRGLDSVYAPERAVNTEVPLTGVGGKQISWKYVQTPERGYVSLRGRMFPDEMVVAYAVTYVYSQEPRKVTMFVGTDDGGKLFLNGREVYRYYGLRIAEPDQAEVELNLRKGWNELMIKVENNMGGFGFYGRILDHNHALVISAEKKGAE